jgi:hypothetical protein
MFEKQNARPSQDEQGDVNAVKFTRYESAFPTQTDAVADEAHSSIVSRRTTRDHYEDRSETYNLSTDYYLNYYRFWKQFKDGMPTKTLIEERIAKLGGGDGDYTRTIMRMSAMEKIEDETLIVTFSLAQDDMMPKIPGRIPGENLEQLPPNEPYWRKGEAPLKLLNYLSEAVLFLLSTSSAISQLEERYKAKITRIELRWATSMKWYGTGELDLTRDVIPEAKVTLLANGDFLFGSREVVS